MIWVMAWRRKCIPKLGFCMMAGARSLQEAILWHDGEGKTARQRYMALSKQERAWLLCCFLNRCESG
jgi:CxxC motif-containing protein (DUF1111 family)